MAESASAAPQLLSDVTVLDLTHHIAGPYCTKLLADYGADVVKVERPGHGDASRRFGPFPGDVPHPEKSGTFLQLNTNKRSITLNLATDSGAALLKELAPRADVVVENFKPGTLERWGLGYETLRALKPELVLVSISNFGQTGPYRDWKSSELITYAMGGALHCTGKLDRGPVKLAADLMQHQAGNVAATAAMGALFAQKHQGVGQWVDVSIMETQAGSIDRRMTFLLAYQYTGWRTARESTYQLALPTGIYPCADGFVQMSVLPIWWRQFCALLGVPELLQDPRFANPATFLSAEHKETIDALLYPWLYERTKEQVMTESQALGIPVTAINTPAETLAAPHFREREYWTRIEHPEAGAWEYPGAPFRASESGWAIRRPAPRLGEHNEAIYGDWLGYSREDLVVLREREII